MKFKDPYNPTDEELRRWSARGDNSPPVQDFDSMVATPERLDLLLELVADDTCRKRRFFLGCLYMLASDTIRSKSFQREVALNLIKRCEGSTSPPLIELADRTRELLKAPETFDYQDWCGGRLARQSILP